MTEYFKSSRLISLLLAAVLFPLAVLGNAIDKDNVKVYFEPLADGTIRVTDVYNNRPVQINVIIDGVDAGLKINASGSLKINRVAGRTVKVTENITTSSGDTYWKFKPLAATPVQAEAPAPVAEPETPAVTSKDAAKGERPAPVADKERQAPKAAAPAVPIVEKINSDPFFSLDAVNEFVDECESQVKAIESAGNKSEYVDTHDLKAFVIRSGAEIELKRKEIPQIAQSLVASSSGTSLNLIVEILTNRLGSREQALTALKTAVDSANVTEEPSTKMDNVLNYCIVGAIVLILLIWMIFKISRRKKTGGASGSAPKASSPAVADEANPSIVVRRRTTSILKRQSLEDVIGNPAYMVISSSDFTADSAVRNIYIKNTCIKEIYNMYAEDLRNSDNPKEDGCMVLGRWVLDEASQTYDVSLETVVFPGDDAVFKEYELNFGGKIKLRIAEKLRKLRRETNLQYDLVCWIHSHPGLGVFFSNSDDNVQMQLKHSQHPNFLIAFVVDILTSDQETGIFTFRRDGSMNSKGDLTRLYSLEEWYKWALASDRESFNPDNYYNILGSAKVRLPQCKGIEMNNSAIIDLTQLLVESAPGLAGWAIGTPIEKDGAKEYMVSGIVKADDRPATGTLGAVLNVSHFSLPTVQRLIAGHGSRLSFVLVYSSRQASLTSIPVINGELVTDEQFYGDETIDDLKIWTRRKR